MQLQLYNYFRSSPSYRVRIAIHLKGLKFEYKPIHLLNNGGEQHSPDYLKINPAREVPALVHNGQVVTQSVAIIEYLDQLYPSPPLYPKDALSGAKVRQLCELINCTHPLINLKVLQFLENKLSLTASQKTQWIKEWFNRSFSDLEEQLKKTAGLYCQGDEITAADLFLIPHIFSAKRYEIEIKNYKLITKINETCLKQEAFIKAHPLRQIDTPPELKI